MDPFSGHRIFQGTAQQTGERASLLEASGAVCGAQDSLVEGEVLVSFGASVLDVTSGAHAHTADVDGELHERNADVSAGVSGAQQVASFAGGGGAKDCAHGDLSVACGSYRS